LVCKFTLVLSSGQNAINNWSILAPMLELARWEHYPNIPNQSHVETPFQGIAIITGGNKDAASCGAYLGKLVGEAFPNFRISLRTEQISPSLIACKNECVELDIGN
jgi:hypothetical protein